MGKIRWNGGFRSKMRDFGISIWRDSLFYLGFQTFWTLVAHFIFGFFFSRPKQIYLVIQPKNHLGKLRKDNALRKEHQIFYKSDFFFCPCTKKRSEDSAQSSTINKQDMEEIQPTKFISPTRFPRWHPWGTWLLANATLALAVHPWTTHCSQVSRAGLGDLRTGWLVVSLVRWLKMLVDLLCYLL